MSKPDDPNNRFAEIFLVVCVLAALLFTFWKATHP